MKERTKTTAIIGGASLIVVLLMYTMSQNLIYPVYDDEHEVMCSVKGKELIPIACWDMSSGAPKQTSIEHANHTN